MKPQDYSQAEAFQAEKRTIFSTEWLPVCAEAQIARPGDYLAATVGGWSIVAVRDGANTARVLRNACRHLNMPVVGTPSGNCENFRCRFHGWTYDLAGKFLKAPAQVAPADPHAASNDLASLAVASAGGILFFSLGKPAAAPALGAAVAEYGGTIVTDIACNWKVLVEHLLREAPQAADGFTWQSPLLAVRRAGMKAIVEQIVPQTFLRTRLFTHVFGEPIASLGLAAGAIKEACERLQAERASGAMANAGNPALAAFHERLEKAYAETSP